MALNPPIESLPIQETDRDGHLQRYLSGLPDFGSWQDQDQGEGPATEIEKTGTDAIQDREIEAAERRNERKIRRREKAAILKPKPQPDPPEELDQEWWDNYRAQKQGLLLDKEVETLRDRNLEIEAERGEMIMEKKENRRLQQRIPKSKGRGKGKGIPGIEIIEAYRPMTTALGPRMTMKPETKKGMFANGKSSVPGVINLIESTKAGNPRVSSSQSTPGRLTMESPERDWRDQWRRKSSQPHPQAQYQVRQINDKLPEPGYTNSPSWPSTLPSSDGPSKPLRSRIGHMEVDRRHSVHRSPGQDLARYLYRHPSLPPLESRRNSEEEGPRYSNDPTYQYRSYPIPHNPSSHLTSTHVLDRHHHHHLRESTYEDHRNIHLNQSTFPQDPRLYHTQDQVHQEHNLYPQTYSPLPPPHSHTHPFPPPHSHSHLYSHSLPFSSPYLYPNHHATHGNTPQTPIIQERRNIDTNLINIPPPFSTPGPSRLPNGPQPLQSHFHRHQLETFDQPASRQDQDQYLYQPDQDFPRGDGLKGFWRSNRRPVIDTIEQNGMGMGMATNESLIFDPYDRQHNHLALPSHDDPHGHLFNPQQHQHDPMDPYRHQHHIHQLHNPTTFPPQVYQTPQIQHQPNNGFESRYETPLPDYHQPNNQTELEDLREEGRVEDLHEKGRVEEKLWNLELLRMSGNYFGQVARHLDEHGGST